MFNIRLATEADMPRLLQIAEAGCPDNDFFFPTKAIPGYFECAWKNRIMTCMYEPHYGSLVLAAEANGIIASWGIFTMADQGNPAEAVSKVASVIRTHFGGEYTWPPPFPSPYLAPAPADSSYVPFLQVPALPSQPAPTTERTSAG